MTNKLRNLFYVNLLKRFCYNRYNDNCMFHFSEIQLHLPSYTWYLTIAMGRGCGAIIASLTYFVLYPHFVNTNHVEISFESHKAPCIVDVSSGFVSLFYKFLKICFFYEKLSNYLVVSREL